MTVPSSPATGSTDRAGPARHLQDDRPGWPEIVIGLLTLAIVGIGGAIGIAHLPIDRAVIGLILTAWSGVGGLAGFAAAFLAGRRSWHAFGMRRVSGRWLLAGAGFGLVALAAKILVMMLYVRVIGQSANVQSIYATGAAGGAARAMLATIFLGIFTPIGEECLFRGVVTNGLLRYGPVIGVGLGGLIFALFHGLNIVFPAALIVGLMAGEAFRRSGSLWPGVMLHIVFNLPSFLLLILAGNR